MFLNDGRDGNKKHISWDGKKYNGYVDLGNSINDDSLPVAADKETGVHGSKC